MSPASTPLPKRRLFRFGPGLALAILASVAIWAFIPRETSHPKILPSPAGASPSFASAPEPHWLMRQLGALGATPVQAFKLSGLVARWDRDTAGLKRELDAATTEVERHMPNRPEAKLSVQQLQQEAAPMAALSREMADARRAWWADARTVLTPAQRARAETAWTDRWTGHGPARQESR